MFSDISRFQGTLMSKQSIFENMGTGYSSLKILQAPESPGGEGDGPESREDHLK